MSALGTVGYELMSPALRGAVQAADIEAVSEIVAAERSRNSIAAGWLEVVATQLDVRLVMSLQRGQLAKLTDLRYREANTEEELLVDFDESYRSNLLAFDLARYREPTLTEIRAARHGRLDRMQRQIGKPLIGHMQRLSGMPWELVPCVDDVMNIAWREYEEHVATLDEFGMDAARAVEDMLVQSGQAALEIDSQNAA